MAGENNTYYKDNLIALYHKNCQDMSELEDNSIDLIVTDPPYGYSFMGKDWDKAVIPMGIWKECLRVLKPGAFAFVMCSPRQDCLGKMVCNLSEAGFETGFTSLYWAYASGFPKAQNIGKAVDKRLGAEREVVGKNPHHRNTRGGAGNGHYEGVWSQNESQLHTGEGNITNPATPQAKVLDGSYGGFQPKPAVEVILVVMKPLDEKTFVDQALKNRKGITWLDDGRIPYENQSDIDQNRRPQSIKHKSHGTFAFNQKSLLHKDAMFNQQGRFPANLLVSDDVLNNGRILKTGNLNKPQSAGDSTINCYGKYGNRDRFAVGDSGSFSRYFDLDKWAQKTFPFLIVPKASKGEKNKGCEDREPQPKCMIDKMGGEQCTMKTGSGNPRNVHYKNNHPTVKPLKLMSYLITLGSREGDTILDPFVGSGTTCLASKLLNRKSVGYELKEQYCEIAVARCRQMILEM